MINVARQAVLFYVFNVICHPAFILASTRTKDGDAGSGVVKVFVMAGQSNMLGSNSKNRKLKKLVKIARQREFHIPPEELTDVFLNQVFDDYMTAKNNSLASPVGQKIEGFLQKTGRIPSSVYLNESCYDLTDNIFKKISEYYFRGSRYKNGYNAFKAMSSAMGVAQIDQDGKLTNDLFKKRKGVNVLQFKGHSNSDGTRSFTESWGALETGFGRGKDMYGPELMFGTYLQEIMDEDVLLLKIVQGGTSLRVDWRSPSSESNICNHYSDAELKTESLYDYMLKKTDLISKPDVLAEYFPEYAGKTIEIAAFIWFQGWNDNNKKSKIQYETNFDLFLSDVRKDFLLNGTITSKTNRLSLQAKERNGNKHK